MGIPSASIELAPNETGLRADKKSTFYKLCINHSGKTWFVSYKFSDFGALNDKLHLAFPSIQMKFPKPKGIFQSKNDPKFLEKRRQGLDKFVQQLLTEPALLASRTVREFLQLDENQDESTSTGGGQGNTKTAKNGDDDDDDEQSLSPVTDDTPVENEEEKVNLGPSERRNSRPSDFEYLKTIGKGSFGKVYLAVHKREGKVYAVKVLNKNHVMKRNEKRHIMSERNVLVLNIKHPFLVGLNYSFQTRDKLYFVLDYLNGGELFYHLQREKRFPEARARFYTAEIASALGYLHSKNIIYRDLKPENLLLNDEGHLIITDFGLCKENVKERDTTNTFCGTPEYLAPEVILKQPYDRTVDWWCLGSVFYEMLFGLPPFYSRDHKEMYERIVNQPLRVSNIVSVSARDILHQMLHKDRNKRLGAKRDVKELIEHPFFATIDFELLIQKKIPVPYVPKIENAKDTSYVDSEFLKEPVSESVSRSYDPASVRNGDGEFCGFTYMPKSNLQVIAED